MGSFGKAIRGRSRLFSRPIMPRSPLGSFRKTVVGFVRGTTAPPARSIHIFRNSTHHNGPMGSFGEADSREKSPVSRPIMPRFPLGSFRKTALASFGEQPTIPIGFVWGKPACPEDIFRNSTHHNGPMGSFGKAIRGRSRPFLDSFSRDCHWVRLVKRRLASFGEMASGRGDDVFRNSTHPNWYWLRSGKTACVIQSEASLVTSCQRTAHTIPSSTMIGGSRERVPGIV